MPESQYLTRKHDLIERFVLEKGKSKLTPNRKALSGVTFITNTSQKKTQADKPFKEGCGDVHHDSVSKIEAERKVVDDYKELVHVCEEINKAIDKV